MMKNILLAVIALFLMAACTEKPALTGIDGTEIPQAFTHFPDIPFPQNSFIDLSETKALGRGANWVGSLVYTTAYNPSSVFDFYVSEMPKLDWQEVAMVRAKISHMTFVKESRAVQILIESNGKESAKVTITAIPQVSQSERKDNAL